MKGGCKKFFLHLTYCQSVPLTLSYLVSSCRWGQLKDLPKMGALAMVQDGDSVLLNLGLGNAKYSEKMKRLAYLAGIYLCLSLMGLSFFGPSFIDANAA